MGNKKQPKNNFRQKPKQSRKRKRRSNRPSLGRLVASGVKTLLASVPGAGSTLATIADFGFKALGLSSNAKLYNAVSVNNEDAAMTALVARFHVKVSSLIVGSRDVIQRDMDRTVLCQYSDGRVIRLSVTVVPTNEASKRQGYWTMSLQPFSTSSDASAAGFSQPWCPTDQGMKHALLSATGSASRSLSLNYVPKMSDGYAYMFQPLDSSYAEIAIRYFDYNRDTYSGFKPSDFNCQVVVSGRVELRVSPTMPPTDSGGYTYSVTVDDKLTSVGMYLQITSTSIPKNASYLTISSNGFKCDEKEKNCSISGIVLGVKDVYEEFERIDI